MSIFDKFFTKFAYKFDKGYPDMNNDQDVLLLETLLEQLVVMEFEDSEGLPEDLLDLKSRINALDGYEVEAIQTNKRGVGTPKGTWIYLKDVSEKGRGLRKDLTDDLIAAHGKCEKLMPLIHLPVQSGSNKILENMNRKHTIEEYLSIIEKLKKVNAKIKLSSDFIIGYPGENKNDFEAFGTIEAFMPTVMSKPSFL